MKLSDIKMNPSNPRVIKDERFDKLKNSISEFPAMLALRPLVINSDNVVLGGNMRLKALKELGYKDIPDEWVKRADALTDEEQRRFIIADNVGFGEHDWAMLATEWDVEELSDWGLDTPNFDIGQEPEVLEAEEKVNPKKLSDRFIIPPFSVLDTKQGAWQQRKNYWLSLGIKSEEGRDAKVNAALKPRIGNPDRFEDKLTSVFDPVLCELVYKWFNIPDGRILDPFAGGSVRGIVAAKLGYEYLGSDLREEQIAANRINAREVLQDAEIYPVWTCGDSFNIDTIAEGYEADLVFSCPPYADLEVYSNKKEDLSNMSHVDFITAYREIIRKSCEKLKTDRFAVFVVGDVRDKKGFYQNFVSDTIRAFWDCDVILYNEMVLVNMLGNLPMRAGGIFASSRKIGKHHQNVLVFYKGDPKNIKTNYPDLDLSYIQGETEYNQT